MSKQSRWQLAGTAPELFEEYIVPAFRETSQELVDLAALQPGERVLEMACGTGIIARLAAQQVGIGGAVVGADVNEDMLNVARSLPQPVGLQCLKILACISASRRGQHLFDHALYIINF